MRGLDGKVVYITGAAGGIGQATAKRFAEEGARVVAIDASDEGLQKLQNRMPDLAALRQLDVSQEEDVATAFAELEDTVGSPDVLINNAGVNGRHNFVEIPFTEWRRVMDVNLNGAFLVAQAAARSMVNNGSGVILNMGSTNGLAGYHRHAIYSAGKAAVVELTRCMALDLAPKIRVNAVCPGFIETPLLSYGKKVSEQLPLGRFGQPEEIAALFAFLASDDAAFITGQALVIDGGELAGSPASDPA